jgi:hypothetical protein
VDGNDASLTAERGRRDEAGARGRLSLLDLLVIAVLLGILLAAAAQEFPGLAKHATPPAAPSAPASG